MSKVKELLLQSLLIFLSVFLGIVASNWNEEKKEKNKTDIFLNNYKQEIEHNKKLLEQSAIYHKKLSGLTDSLFEEATRKSPGLTIGEFGPLNAVKGWKGLGIGSLEQSVYESAVVGGIFEHLSMDVLTRISKLNAIQKEYIRFTQSISDRLLAMGTTTQLVDFYIIIDILGNDLRYLEEKIVDIQSETLLEIEAITND